jgi:hypothetical protein
MTRGLKNMAEVLVRWTIGDVSWRGFDALALSIAGAKRVFGPSARYVVCVNSIPASCVADRVGGLSKGVEWLQADCLLPLWLRRLVDRGMAQGVAWKFAPISVATEIPTLALDNDVVLWAMPDSVRCWLHDGDTLLIAEDVQAHYGAFEDRCPTEPRNSGIRGTPAGYPLEERLLQVLEQSGRQLKSEGDEQGLQVALVTSEEHRVVELEEVSICGYFRPHQLQFGSCGAHFVGVNAKKLPYRWKGRSGEHYVHEFWDAMKPQLLSRIWPVEELEDFSDVGASAG